MAGAPEAQKKQVPMAGVQDYLIDTDLLERYEVGEPDE